MADHSKSKTYILGSGIGGLSTATFLIRDAGYPAKNITIFEQLPAIGGSMDGTMSPLIEKGYVSRGGRMVEKECFATLWNLMASIPCPERPGLTIYDDFLEFNSLEKGQKHNSKARLINKGNNIIDAQDYGLNLRDKLDLLRIMATPESIIGARRITDYFNDHFFQTNFWSIWRTFFAFQPWHSAIEMRRYIMRFTHNLPEMHSQICILRTRYNQYDSIVHPIEIWLRSQGVKFEQAVIDDANFSPYNKDKPDAERYCTALHLHRCYADSTGRQHVQPKKEDMETIKIGKNDFVYMTLGSMTADSSMGNETVVPKIIREKRDGAWKFWDNIAPKAPDFGRPNTFCGNIDESLWESFTLTMTGYTLLSFIHQSSGNEPGGGVLTTLVDSNWFLTFTVPHAPHFNGQPDGSYTLWGYALDGYRKGNYVNKTMHECNGMEIIDELLYNLGLIGSPLEKQIRAETRITTVMMPYITSQFARRDVADRPLVVPRGSKNFAFLGQFTEIPEDVVFTVEYSVRGAMSAVYKLLNVKKPRPGIYHGLYHPIAAWKATRTLVTGWGSPCYF